MVRVLEINSETEEDVVKVIEYAKEHKYTMAMSKLVNAGDLPPAGLDPNFLLYIHDGFRVIYSIEEQPSGWCHHISISVEVDGKYPNEHAVQMILMLFNMYDPKKEQLIWLDKSSESVNALFPFEENSHEKE